MSRGLEPRTPYKYVSETQTLDSRKYVSGTQTLDSINHTFLAIRFFYTVAQWRPKYHLTNSQSDCDCSFTRRRYYNVTTMDQHNRALQQRRTLATSVT